MIYYQPLSSLVDRPLGELDSIMLGFLLFDTRRCIPKYGRSFLHFYLSYFLLYTVLTTIF